MEIMNIIKTDKTMNFDPLKPALKLKQMMKFIIYKCLF